MTTAIQVAQYFLSKDPNAQLFAPADSKHVIELNGSTPYEGNVRLNKYLHIAQNLYIAMYGEKLFDDDIYAYTNGGVVPAVQNNYAFLRKGVSLDKELDDEGKKKFLDRFNVIYDYAPLDELIEISHEDPEWEEKTINPFGQQKMSSLERIDEYKEQYEDAIYVFTHEDFGVE